MSDEELVCAYYGEHNRGHLTECGECRAAYARLEAILAEVDALPVPERGEGYGREVWVRLQPRLVGQAVSPVQRFWQSLLSPPKWAVAGAVALLIAGAFFAGRFWPYRQPAPTPAQAITEGTRERVLMVAVGDHLDRSQMVLLEFVHAPGGPEVDISGAQRRADDLVAANRLYRQTATRAGETGIASVLDELERVLLEIARSPAVLSSKEFEDMRRRIEAQGIVFKIRVLDTRLEQQTLGRSSAL